MNVHYSSAVLFLVFVHLLVGATSFPKSVSDWDHNSESNYTKNKKVFPAADDRKFRSTAVFGVHGNVYPQGYFYTQIPIGNRFLNLDIDTGSELTWIKCEGSKHQGENTVVRCNEPFCNLVQQPPQFPCRRPSDPCHYHIQYADGGTSTGSLVKENLPIKLTNGNKVNPLINIGCEEYKGSHSQSQYEHGVLGLANTKVSILSQLSEMGITGNVIGHCLSTSGTGYLFFGNDWVPRSGVVWVPMSNPDSDRLGKYYSLGPADLTFEGAKKSISTGLSLILDSGSTYTYFDAGPYDALLTTIEKNRDPRLKRVSRAEDDTLPVCWKGPKKFGSINEVAPFFKKLALHFPRSGNVVMEIPPPSYLIVSEKGNACLGILLGAQGGVGSNLIGDISMLDKLVIYDNERKLIGWIPRNCHARRKL